MKKYIVIIFFTLFCISSFLGGVYFNNFINNWDLLILTFGLLGFYLCLLENKITKELFLLLFFIILVPLIFFSGLSLIDTRLVSLINDWIGFLGAYLGVIGTIGAIWWQLNEEKRKQQLGSLKLYQYYFKSINSEIENIKKIFSNLLPISSTTNYGYFILNKIGIEVLYNNFKNISLLPFSMDVWEIIAFILQAEERALNYQDNQDQIKSNFKDCFPTIKKSNSFYSEVNTLILALDDLHSVESFSSEHFDNLRNSFNKFKDSLPSFIKEPEILKRITKKDIYSLYHMSFYIKDLTDFLYFKEESPEIYTFDKLSKEIIKVLPKIEKEIKKLS